MIMRPEFVLPDILSSSTLNCRRKVIRILQFLCYFRPVRPLTWRTGGGSTRAGLK